MKFNTAGQQFHVIAFNAAGRVSGDEANITSGLALDNGGRNPLNDLHPVEIGTTGEYVFDLLTAETNGHKQSFSPASSTPGVNVVGVPSNVIYTENLEAVASSVWGTTIAVGVTAASALVALLSRITGVLRTATEDADADTALLTALGALQGVNERRLTVAATESGNGVVGVRISVDGTQRVATTNVFGVASVNLPQSATAYTVKVTPPLGYEYVSDLSVTIGSVDVNRSVALVFASLEEPDSPELANTLINVFSQFGVPLQGAKVVAEVTGDPAIANSAVLVNVVDNATTSSTGQARLQLYRGQSYRFTITYQRFSPIVLTRLVPVSGGNFVVTAAVS